MTASRFDRRRLSEADAQNVPEVVSSHDLGAEKALLGAVMIDNPQLSAAAEILVPTDFFRIVHGRVFSAMLSLRDLQRPIDLLTLADALSTRSELEDVGGVAYFSGLTEGVPRASNTQAYARIIKTCSSRRRLADIAKRASSAVDPEVVLAELDGLRNGTGSTTPLNLLTACECSFDESAEQEFLVEGIVPAKGHWLGFGAERTMKSLTKRAIAVAVASGCSPFGTTQHRVREAKPVIYITEEDSAQAVFGHLDALSGGTLRANRLPIHVSASNGVSLDDPRTQDALIAQVQKKGAALVVIEPLRSLTECVDQGPREFQPFGNFLRRLVRETGVATMLGHHSVKKRSGVDNRKGGQVLSGGGMLSYCESPCLFSRLDQNRVRLEPVSWKHCETPKPFILRLETASGKVARLLLDERGSVPESDGHEQLTRLIHVISEAPGLSTTEVIRRAKVNNQRARQILNDCEHSGQLVAKQGKSGKHWHPATEWVASDE